MWYIYGTKWLPQNGNEPVARVYKIAHASSIDGKTFIRGTGNQIIPDVLDENECQALPTVIKIGEKYHMIFCFRYATDFRGNPNRGYKLGYAYSSDLKNWKRDDNKLQFSNSSNTPWDSEMMCYPHLFRVNSKIYLLYNGNAFGKYGFGLAELDSL